MMPGVVSLPHGWGHGLDGTQLQVANDRPGVNSNLLNPAHLIDVPSNTQVVNGVPCQVRNSTVRSTPMVAPNLPKGFDFTDPDIYATRLPIGGVRRGPPSRADLVERAATRRRRVRRRRLLGGQQAPRRPRGVAAQRRVLVGQEVDRARATR